MEAALQRPGVLGVLPPGAAEPAVGEVALDPPAGLTLERVARSHGWCALPPYAYDRGTGVLHRVLGAPAGGLPVHVRVRPDWVAEWTAPVDPARVATVLRWCLGLDDDRRSAPAAARATRVLRCPTLWEDLVKVLATTHCSWRTTAQACAALVGAGDGAWPSPAVVLGLGVAWLRGNGFGYRAPSLLALAHACGAGAVDRDAWCRLDDAELTVRVLALRGFGPQSAAAVPGLLGRPRRVVADRWVLDRLGLTAQQVAERTSTTWGGEDLWAEVTAGWFTPAAVGRADR